MSMYKNFNGGGFMSGLMLGALIGAVLGILYAPKKGEETREDLKKKADEWKKAGLKKADEWKRAGAEKAQEISEQTRTGVSEFKRRAKRVARELRGPVEDIKA